MVRFEEPWYLLGVLLSLVAIAFLSYYRNKTIERFSKFANPELIPGYSDQTGRNFKIRNTLLAIALMLISVALANPQWSTTKTTLSNSKADVFIVLDVSRSMTAEDILPSRLDKTKQFLYRLLSEMKSVNSGLILFAGRAYLQLPLTEDVSAVSSFINGADPDMIPAQGTSIGPSIDLATRMFSKESQNKKIILVLSDGEDHDADAVEKAEAARKAGIIVNTIGVGTAEGGTMPIYNAGIKDVKKDEDGNPIITKLNKAALREIAKAGGGKYFDVSDGETAVRYISSSAAGGDRTNLRKQEYTDFESFFAWFLAPALLILLGLFFSDKISFKPKTTNNIQYKKITGLIAFGMLCTSSLQAQESLNVARNGDQLYKEGKYAEAERKYDSALKKQPENYSLLYNRSNAQYQQDNFAEAGKSYEKVIQSATDKQLKAKAFYNKGNADFKQENYGEAIKSYRNALKINPADDNARKNLSIALKKLKKQQQQEQNQKEQEKEQKDNPQNNQQQNKKTEQQSKAEQKKSKEEAERLLRIIENEEKNVMKKLPKQNAHEYVNDKDW